MEHPPLRDYVQDKLGGRQHWSPEQISRRIVLDIRVTRAASHATPSIEVTVRY